MLLCMISKGVQQSCGTQDQYIKNAQLYTSNNYEIEKSIILISTENLKYQGVNLKNMYNSSLLKTTKHYRKELRKTSTREILCV